MALLGSFKSPKTTAEPRVAAGLLGLGLMCLYMILYYRRLGLVAMASDDQAARLYEAARRYLAKRGYDHEEVSNWSLLVRSGSWLRRVFTLPFAAR